MTTAIGDFDNASFAERIRQGAARRAAAYAVEYGHSIDVLPASSRSPRPVALSVREGRTVRPARHDLDERFPTDPAERARYARRCAAPPCRVHFVDFTRWESSGSGLVSSMRRTWRATARCSRDGDAEQQDLSGETFAAITTDAYRARIGIPATTTMMRRRLSLRYGFACAPIRQRGPAAPAHLASQIGQRHRRLCRGRWAEDMFFVPLLKLAFGAMAC